MSSINNIDELLKNSLGHLEQTPPPDAWSGIQQGLSNVPTTGTEGVAAKSAVTAVKSATLLTKIIVAVATSTVIVGGYVAYTYFNNIPAKEEASTTALPSDELLTEEKGKEEEESPIADTKNTVSPAVSEKDNKKFGSSSNGTKENNQPSKTASSSPISITKEDGSVDNNSISKDESSINVSAVENKAIEKQASAIKSEVKPVIKPKPKHNFTDEEKTTGSNSSAFIDDNQEAKPVIGAVFTPNNDGKNDEFKIEIEKEVFYDLKIYDRDGKTVFESNSKDNLWNGSVHNIGEPCSPGTYHYVFRYQYSGGKIRNLSGAIMLLKN